MLFLLILGALAAIPSSIGIWYFLTTQDPKEQNAKVIVLCICGAFAILGIYLILSTCRSRLVIHRDYLEVHELTRTKVVRRADIKGWRIMSQSTPGALVLLPKEGAGKKASVALIYGAADELDQWLEDIPNLDEEEMIASVDEVATETAFGATPEDRIDALNRARSAEKWLTWGGIAISAWGLAYPYPYEIAITVMILAPWIAISIVAFSKGLFRMDGHNNDLHPNVATLFLLPALALLGRAALDVKILDWELSLLFTAYSEGCRSAFRSEADRDSKLMPITIPK